jgi:hypothetical protein
MPNPEQFPESRSRRPVFPRPRFQFSLWWLMIAVTIVAVLLFLVTRVSGFVGIVFVSFVVCVVPTPLVICAIYGRGDVRAFSIGAMVPWVIMLSLRFPSTMSSVFEVIWLLLMGGISGVIALATRRWLPPNDPA